MTDRWDWLIKKVSSKWKLDWRLVKAVVEQESGGRPEVESHCGAVGLMQLMPATAEELGCPADDRTDPEKNLEAGCRYLDQLYSRFGEIPGLAERWKFALASYNGGRGHINRALRAAAKAEKGWRRYRWEIVKKYLTRCRTQEIIHYVDGVFTKYVDYAYEEPPRLRRAVYSVLLRIKPDKGTAVA